MLRLLVSEPHLNSKELAHETFPRSQAPPAPEESGGLQGSSARRKEASRILQFNKQQKTVSLLQVHSQICSKAPGWELPSELSIAKSLAKTQAELPGRPQGRPTTSACFHLCPNSINSHAFISLGKYFRNGIFLGHMVNVCLTF